MGCATKNPSSAKSIFSRQFDRFTSEKGKRFYKNRKFYQILPYGILNCHLKFCTKNRAKTICLNEIKAPKPFRMKFVAKMLKIHPCSITFKQLVSSMFESYLAWLHVIARFLGGIMQSYLNPNQKSCFLS